LDTEPQSTASSPDRRLFVLGGLAALTVVALLIGFLRSGGGGDSTPLPPGAIPIDVWAPYWTIADADAVAATRLDDVREVSPFWFGARGATSIVVDENASSEATDAFMEIAHDSDAKLVPSIRDEMPAGGMAAVLANPASRTTHVQTITDFADQLDADGIDLDYEQFAFADGRETWATTSPNWVAFIEELADELHADGRTLTVSIPPVYDETQTGDRGYWVYDHGAIAEFVDAIRIMAYDYSVAEPGPIAPTAWVQQSVDGVSKAVPEEYHSKLVLGVPAYGSNWVVATNGTCPTTAEGKTTVTAANVEQLAALRGGTPTYDPSIGEWTFTYELPVTDATLSCVQSRVVRWVDSEGAAARAKIGRDAGWGGAALWALGYEDDDVWSSLVTATQS